jgi:hypothetical protein
MVRKSPDIQWNRQNSILFHATFPLNAQNTAIQERLYNYSAHRNSNASFKNVRLKTKAVMLSRINMMFGSGSSSSSCPTM